MSELELSHLSTGYHHPEEVLHDISLIVRSGQISALIGANGAGKTTTLGAISGLLRPWSGAVKLDGAVISGRPPASVVRAGISHVPEGRGILPGLTVTENLAMGAYVVTKQRARLSMARVHDLFPTLAQRAKQLGGTLSGGEQQMLAIARALMSEPRILLLDEPSMGLAPQFVERIFEHIDVLRLEGLGILLVEQNAKLAFETADYAYVIERGAIALEGPPNVCAADARVQQAYLGV